MDFWGLLTFVFLAVIFISCCSYCCTSKQRGAVLSTPVVVTSTTHTAPGGYPVAQMPPVSGYEQQTMYPPYPTHAAAHGQMMPMPLPVAQPPAPGMQPYVAPYPPMPAATANPPSYEAAVTGVGLGQPNNAISGYEKQSPYNPNYSAY